MKTLYKLSTKGKLTQWLVSTQGNTVTCEYGQVNGKLQVTTETIKGKNLGKSNETTDEEQAVIKAQQLYDKKIKSGYVTSKEDALSENNSLDSIEPMLAFTREKKEKYVEFPCYSQAKLDGSRCITIVKDGKASMFSRTRKPITTLPHIVAEIEERFKDIDIILDGELYNHKLKDNFNRIMKLIKRNEVHEDAKEIQYHIYDSVSNDVYFERISVVNDNIIDCEYLKKVPFKMVYSDDEIKDTFDYHISEGYEGSILRNISMPYEHKRSVSLLKVKVMTDAEFTVIGVEEGKGKLAGTAGAIILKDSEGREFKAKMKSYENSQGKRIESKEDFQARCIDWYVNIDKYLNKQATVRFQGITPIKADGTGGVPRFPILIRIREEE